MNVIKYDTDVIFRPKSAFICFSEQIKCESRENERKICALGRRLARLMLGVNTRLEFAIFDVLGSLWCE